MNLTWQGLLLDNLHIYRWRGASYLYRWVGLLSAWQQGSWLLQWSELWGAILVSLILVLSPLVSTTLIGVLLLAGAAYWLLVTICDRTFPGVTPIHLLLLLYWGIATVATAFSPVKSAAASGWIKLSLYLLFFALAARVLRSPRLQNWLITIFLHVALLVSSYGVRQQFFGVEQLATWNDPNSPLAGDTRVYSYLGNPNLLAGYLLPAIALSIAAIFVWRGLLPKLLALVMVTVNSACLYFTDSRGGWIGMVVLTTVFLLLLRYWYQDYLPRFWQKWLLPIVLLGLSTLIITALISVEPLRLRVSSIFAGREDSSNNFRINVWYAVLDMIRDRPLIGIGPGNDAFNKIYPLYMRPQYSALSAYSIYLEIAVETGLIGLACFTWLIMVIFNRGIIQINRWRKLADSRGFWFIAALAGMAGMLAHGVVDTVWYRPQISLLWWLMMAIIASYGITEERKLSTTVNS